MVAVQGRKGWRFAGVGVVALMALGAAEMKRRSVASHSLESIRTFSLTYQPPKGWEERPHSPQTLFLYALPKTGLLLAGAVNSVVSDINPTPWMNADRIADDMLYNTSHNLVGWGGEKLGTVDCGGSTFRLVRRWRDGKRVVNAFAARGNTIVMITLSANGADVKNVDAALPEFRNYLSSLALKPEAIDRDVTETITR